MYWIYKAIWQYYQELHNIKFDQTILLLYPGGKTKYEESFQQKKNLSYLYVIYYYEKLEAYMSNNKEQ